MIASKLFKIYRVTHSVQNNQRQATFTKLRFSLPSFLFCSSTFLLCSMTNRDIGRFSVWKTRFFVVALTKFSVVFISDISEALVQLRAFCWKKRINTRFALNDTQITSVQSPASNWQLETLHFRSHCPSPTYNHEHRAAQLGKTYAKNTENPVLSL